MFTLISAEIPSLRVAYGYDGFEHCAHRLHYFYKYTSALQPACINKFASFSLHCNRAQAWIFFCYTFIYSSFGYMRIPDI